MIYNYKEFLRIWELLDEAEIEHGTANCSINPWKPGDPPVDACELYKIWIDLSDKDYIVIEAGDLTLSGYNDALDVCVHGFKIPGGHKLTSGLSAEAAFEIVEGYRKRVKE